MSVLGVITELLTIDVRLSHDIILLVLLPPLLFGGAAATDLAQFKRNFGPILSLALSLGGLLLVVGTLSQLRHRQPRSR